MCEGLQSRRIEFGKHDIASAVLEEPTLRQRDRRALISADAKHRHANSRGARTLRRHDGIVAGGIRQNHDLATIESRLPDQIHAKIDRATRVVALRRHHR
ncbi:MAG TPA: hypothetical protein VLK26_10135, partial [Rudaea sp.]|nr:hypothetical protein [Rudaea sp.]